MSLLSSIDQRNWYQVMDQYAQWVPQNLHKCKTGVGSTVMPLEYFTSPWGIISFLREAGLEEKEASYVRLQVSTLLSKEPADVEKKAKVFAETFKHLLTIKKKNKNKRDQATAVKAKKKDKALEEFLVNSPVFADDKKETTFSSSSSSSVTSNAEILIALAQAGAKLKSPDGWEVQF